MKFGRDPETGARDSLEKAVATELEVPSGDGKRPVVVAPSVTAVRAVAAAVDDGGTPVRVVTTTTAWRDSSVTAAGDNLSDDGDTETVSWRLAEVDPGGVTVARRVTVAVIDTTPVGGVTVARVADGEATGRYRSIWRDAAPVAEAVSGVDRVASDTKTGDSSARGEPGDDTRSQGDGGEVQS